MVRVGHSATPPTANDSAKADHTTRELDLARNSQAIDAMRGRRTNKKNRKKKAQHAWMEDASIGRIARQSRLIPGGTRPTT
jgi:hypothetical protein